ncbi:fimbrial protein FimH [Cronobacter dublinensis]|uniref:Fimbrial protein FimH n=1 Tax=Cronobacter dublinensis TaxID=413497 RepID=A0A9Q4XMD1_9ENTR|nr:fimbrial protein [Cronobacter dublinensis]NCH87339.1 fimbrial protein FimH [Cronobacter dublinensis]
MKNKKPKKAVTSNNYLHILQCIASIFIFWLSQPALAFTCTGPYGTIPSHGGEVTVPIDVNPQFELGKNILIDLNQIKCINDYQGIVDTLYISDKTPPTTVAQLQSIAGLEISGTNYSLASSTGKLILPGFDSGSRTIPIRFFIYLDQQIVRPVNIKKGDLILKIQFRQTSSYDGTWYYTWNFISNNDTDIYTTTCKVNGGNVIDVDYQSVIVTDVKPYANQSITREVPLHFNCDDKNYSSPVKMTLSAAAAGQYDENGAFLTSTTGLGITMLHNGSVVPVNGSFSSVITNGQGSDNVSFALVKQNASTRLATGAFQASASLIMETE